VLANGLPATSEASPLEALAAGNATLIGEVNDITPGINAAVKDAYLACFKRVYLVTIALGCFAIIGALFSRNLDDAMTEHVARKLRVGHVEDESHFEKLMFYQLRLGAGIWTQE
jgi:hypothetical protein